MTAVTPNGEFSGTPTQVTVPTGSPINTIALSWSAYTDPDGASATSYRIYGRDNGSTTAEGLRLLTSVATTSWTDTGPPLTTLSSNVTLPTPRFRGRHVDVHLVAEHDLLRHVRDRDVHREDARHRSRAAAAASPATYPSGTQVFQDDAAPIDAAPPLATLNVSLVLDQTPGEDTSAALHADDMISLRNSGRF